MANWVNGKCKLFFVLFIFVIMYGKLRIIKKKKINILVEDKKFSCNEKFTFCYG